MFKLTTSMLDVTALSNNLLNGQANNENIFNDASMERTNLGIETDKITLQPLITTLSLKNTINDIDMDDDLVILERLNDEALYSYEKLNQEQRIVYDYVAANPQDIITIQAGPGCGKSFLLKTIAYNLPNIHKHVIIFKHDLLYSFRHCAERHTVAKFIMQTLQINYFEYKALDKQISMNITSVEFMLSIVAMIKKAQLKNIKFSILFLDEYTIVSKPILLILLMILEYHKIGTIICGDKNQLQNIHNSQHAILSAHTLAKSFSRREFNLHINERCKDTAYNNFVNYFADFSSNRKLDNYTYAILSTVFINQLVQLPNYNSIHLASTHQELTNLIHTMVCNNKYHTDFYLVDQSRIQSEPNTVLQHTLATMEYLSSAKSNNEVPVPGKFLPYLPLVIGARYYILKHSEYSQGVLVEYRHEDGIIKMLYDNGTLQEFTRMSSKQVLFDEHCEYLMRNVEPSEDLRGTIYGFPIYPANFMSIHKCQGCTIRGELDLILNKTNYQGLYVALSRVTSPKQIARVTIPNQVSHLVSTIVNYPEHCIVNGQIGIDLIRERMINYKFYQIDNSIVRIVGEICLDFILAVTYEAKFELRQKLLDYLIEYQINFTILQNPTILEASDYNLITMSKIIKYRDVFRALACLNVLDYNVWLHEFILANPDMSLFLKIDGYGDVSNQKSMMENGSNSKCALARFADWESCYPMDVSTKSYIRHFAKTNVHIEPTDQETSMKLFCIDNTSAPIYVETTEFCCKVYRKYENNEEITMRWLIDELNEMLRQLYAKRNERSNPNKNFINIQSRKQTTENSIFLTTLTETLTLPRPKTTTIPTHTLKINNIESIKRPATSSSLSSPPPAPPPSSLTTSNDRLSECMKKIAKK